MIPHLQGKQAVDYRTIVLFVKVNIGGNLGGIFGLDI